MVTIRKLQSGKYQVLIRIKGLPHIAETFSKKKDALNFAKQVEGDTELHCKLGKASFNTPTWVIDSYKFAVVVPPSCIRLIQILLTDLY